MNFKKFLSLFLTLVLVVGLVPTAFAAPTTSSTVTVYAEDAYSHGKIQGAGIRLEDVTSGRYHDYGVLFTDGSGRAVFSGIQPGSYRITQTIPGSGYLNNASVILVDVFGENIEHTFSNTPEGAIIINRISTNGDAVGGGVYEVRNSNNVSVGRFTANANGVAVATGLQAGWYYISEVTAPAGAVKDATVRHAEVIRTQQTPTTVTFSASTLGSITVMLANVVRGPISGAQIRLTDARGNTVSSATTNTSGIVVFAGLQPGSYEVRQATVVEDYINDLKSTTVTLDSAEMNKSVTLSNDFPGALRINTVTPAGDLLDGVSYNLYFDGTKVGDAIVGNTYRSGLASGVYTVVATAPESFVIDNTTLSATVEPNTVTDITFTATGKGNLVITAVTADGAAVSGVRFKVRTMDGVAIGTYSTDSRGNITLPSLESGVVVVEAIEVPTGYVLETMTRDISITPGSTINSTFVIRTQPFIVVGNFIHDTNIPLAGSTFELVSSSGAVMATGVSDADGMVTFYNIQPGDYTVRNTAAPAGYSVVAPAQTVHVESGKSGTITFTAMRQSSIVVRALDAEGRGLADAQFTVRNSDGIAIETLTSDASGIAISESHESGLYYVQMTFAPNGYVPTTGTQHKVQVVNLKDTVQDFVFGAKSSVVIYAYDMAGEPVVGAEYAIVDAVSGAERDHVITDESGAAVSKVLEPGFYIARALTTPDKYVSRPTYEIPVIVTTDRASAVRFVYQHKGTIQISAVDNTTNEVLRGGEYTVAEAQTGNLVGRYILGEGSYAVTSALPQGEYIVKQVVPAESYALQQLAHRVTVSGDAAQTIVFRSERLSGLVIECVEQGSHERLSGSTFEVYDEQQKQIFCGSTDDTGIITLPNLAAGTYLIKHITAPAGFRVAETTRKAVITVNGYTTEVMECVALTSLTVELLDKDSHQPLAGSKFKVQSIGGEFITEGVTGDNGSFTVDNLPVGNYMVSQMTPAANHNLEPDYQWATVKIGENTHVTFVNARTSGIVIQAMELGSEALLSDASFQVWEQNGKLVGEYTPNATGSCVIDSLPAGTYLIKESRIPNGYSAMTASQEITVTDGRSTTAIFYHRAHGNVIVKATNRLTNEGIAGAVFNVFTATNEYVGQYTTGNTGAVTLPKLTPGEYYLTCIKAPNGYLLNETPVTFRSDETTTRMVEIELESTSDLTISVTAKQDGQPVSGITVKLTTLAGALVGNYTTNEDGIIRLTLMPGDYVAYQTYGPSDVELDKNPQNVKIAATSKNTLEMQVKRLSEITVKMVDEDTHAGIYNVRLEVKDWRNNYVGTYVTDNSGYVRLNGIMDSGRYIITLLDCPTNYIKDTTPKTVELDIGKSTNIIWELAARKGQVVITTRSATDNAARNLYAGSLLPDAIYTITDENGNVVNTIYGDAYGEAFSGVLPLGRYYVRQIQAPYGYIINTQKVTLNITSTNAKVNVTVYNKSADASTTVDMGGPKSATAGSEIKYYFTDIRNTSKVAVPQLLFHIKLPTDAVRAGTLFTGTWTGTGNYNISYSTNKSDYRRLASDLSPIANYSYDLSSTALKLAADEYVTNIRFEFTNAVSGFHSEVSPTLYCSLLPTLPVGYQVICRTEAAVNYNGNWSKDAKSWTTTVGVPSQYPVASETPVVQPGYPIHTIVIPATLPKTGY